MKNRVLMALCMVLFLAVSIIACGKKNSESKGSESKSSESSSVESSVKDESSSVKESSSSAESSTPAESSSSAESSTPAENDSERVEVAKTMTAIELTRLMGNGTNLGNTLEAIGSKRDFSSVAITDMEAYGSIGESEWGQPATTFEMMKEMKKGGFDSIRIPVGWTKGMDNISSYDYTISEEFFGRVDEIIGFALDAGLIVVVNDHWDGGWWGMFGSADEKTAAEAWKLYESMWTQISERYKDYPLSLVFEGANEELCASLNEKIAGTPGKLSDNEWKETSNAINQKFVDVVRATGGNNADRFLLIPGFNTDIERTCDDSFKMPTDTAKDKLLISVHYYTPSGYCLFEGVSNWGTGSNVEEMNRLLKMMTKFTDKGYGVIIGEYGALKKNGAYKDGYMDWYTNFIDNCDIYGYAPMLWDCSDLFARKSLTWTDESLAKLYLDRKADTSSEEEKAANAQKAVDARVEAAKAQVNENRITDDPNASVAWIMYTDDKWAVQYRVGDKYDLDAYTDGVIAKDVLIEDEGTYTVSLDITPSAKDATLGFMAVGIANGENNFEDYVIDIKEIKINGEKVELTAQPYTCSDDKICTRVNIYNPYVNAAPKTGIRYAEGVDKNSISAQIIDPSIKINTIEITFDYYES